MTYTWTSTENYSKKVIYKLGTHIRIRSLFLEDPLKQFMGKRILIQPFN